MKNNPPNAATICRVLFVTGIVSPFWLEFAQAVNALPGFSFSIAFTKSTLGDRGGHWHEDSLNLEGHYFNNKADLSAWLPDVFYNVAPSVVIAGGIKGDAAMLAYKYAKLHKAHFGVFAEQPNLKGAWLNLLNRLAYKWLFMQRRPEFFLAVGDRAVDLYRNLLPKSCHIAFFPYYQRLIFTSGRTEKGVGAPLRFLFSGRLVPRNSIKEMVDAFEKLTFKRPGAFLWCVSAHGPEERWIRDAINRSDEFAKHVYFDRDFTKWDDRLKPFSDSDILIVPAKHSGWGLVVPEALSSGLPVVTTRYVEAARYYVEDMVNGLFVEPESEDIYRALEFAVDNPAVVSKLKLQTRDSARKGDVAHGAARFALLLQRWGVCH